MQNVSLCLCLTLRMLRRDSSISNIQMLKQTESHISSLIMYPITSDGVCFGSVANCWIVYFICVKFDVIFYLSSYVIRSITFQFQLYPENVMLILHSTVKLYQYLKSVNLYCWIDRCSALWPTRMWKNTNCKSYCQGCRQMHQFVVLYIFLYLNFSPSNKY